MHWYYDAHVVFDFVAKIGVASCYVVDVEKIFAKHSNQLAGGNSGKSQHDIYYTETEIRKLPTEFSSGISFSGKPSR